MKKIKAPFPYFGSKGRFYNEIKEIFLNNYRKNFIDLFAGGMEIPLNLKNEYEELNVLVNVKDEKLEAFIDYNNVYDFYNNALKYLCGEIDFLSARQLYTKDKERFEEINKKFKSIFNNICPCCGRKISGKVENSRFNDDEKKILKLLMGFGGTGTSLGNTFYSREKAEKLKNYVTAIRKIKVMSEMFSEDWTFENSFIFLDPPYIQKTKKDEKNFIGYEYAEASGVDWSIKDDERLINFIKKNYGKNNVFLVFGSEGNNLQRLLKENFKCEFINKEYKYQTFGKMTDRIEYFCLIKEV